MGCSYAYKDNYIDTNLFNGMLSGNYITVPSGKAGYAFGVANVEVTSASGSYTDTAAVIPSP